MDRPYLRSVADRLGLSALGRPVRRLSTGNRQRAALLCVFAHRPELIMLDEPTLGLDADGIAALQIMLNDEQQRGASVVSISHDAGFVAAIAERVVGMQAGRCMFERAGSIVTTAVERFTLMVEAAHPLPASALADLAQYDTFAGQLGRLQQLSRIYPDIRSAAIAPVTPAAGRIAQDTEVLP